MEDIEIIVDLTGFSFLIPNSHYIPSEELFDEYRLAACVGWCSVFLDW